MITNSELTIYHIEFDKRTKLEKYVRYTYSNVWWYGGRGSSLNKGFEKSNDVKIRIPYGINENINIDNFSIGDIIVQGNIAYEITSQNQLSNYNIYKITSIVDNTYGDTPHIHIGGK